MNIALDFDGTFTADPSLWLDFINRANLFGGHRVYIVTARDGENDGINWSRVGLMDQPCEVIWCDGRPKREVTKLAGVHIDIWIDDNPAAIIMKHTSFSTPEGLAAWRRTDEYRGSTLPITGASRGFEDSGRAQGYVSPPAVRSVHDIPPRARLLNRSDARR